MMPNHGGCGVARLIGHTRSIGCYTQQLTTEYEWPRKLQLGACVSAWNVISSSKNQLCTQWPQMATEVNASPTMQR